jgi:hypothetical protein
MAAPIRATGTWMGFAVIREFDIPSPVTAPTAGALPGSLA